jgi:hypothetical protein
MLASMLLPLCTGCKMDDTGFVAVLIKPMLCGQRVPSGEALCVPTHGAPSIRKMVGAHGVLARSLCVQCCCDSICSSGTSMMVLFCLLHCA